MSDLDSIIQAARSHGASDVHLEGGLAPTLRVQGELRALGDPISSTSLLHLAQELLRGDAWDQFLQRGSADLSSTIEGVRCRINILQSSRGIGFAIRLLSAFQATLGSLNLHPDLKRLVSAKHGLVMLCGPTGCGKSSTMAALLQEINLSEARHIVTIESPIEHVLAPRMSLIRQRQVGRDTPSFEQALVDALREDPDVIMVGEMRDPETMRLTLNAAETGHLVFTTVHSSSCAEAIARVVGAFPADAQPSIAAQLADCLAGVVCQRLRFRAELNMRVPECEVMMPSTGVRGIIRSASFTRLSNALEGGAGEGHWTWARYRAWLDARTDFVSPALRAPPATTSSAPEASPAARFVPLPPAAIPVRPPSAPSAASAPSAPSASRTSAKPAPHKVAGKLAPAKRSDEDGDDAPGVLVIDESDDDPAAILEQL
ncbi:MAG TPA: ATPase, T2SS/T4P/T4SS family, partial [Myxococcota bacterium]